VIYVLQVELSRRLGERKQTRTKYFTKKEYFDPLTLPSNIIGRRKQAERLVRQIHGLGEGLLVPLISVYGKKRYRSPYAFLSKYRNLLNNH